MLKLVDLHCDFANNYVPDARFLVAGLRTATRYSYDFTRQHEEGDLFAVDYPSLTRANTKALICSIHSPLVHDGQPLGHVLSVANMVMDAIERADGIELVRDRQSFLEVTRRGMIAVVLGLENADVFHRDLNVLSSLFRLGFRACTPAWYGRNCVCDSGRESEDSGLSSFGRRAVERMVELGMLVDVSHMNAAGIHDCLRITGGRGLFASHSDCFAECPTPRNLSDPLLEQLAESGGCVGITFVPRFLNGTERAGVADVVRHIQHAVQVMGPDAVAIGSDFDGTNEHVTGLERISQVHNLAEALASDGLSAHQIENVFWRNATRFLMDNLPA